MSTASASELTATNVQLKGQLRGLRNSIADALKRQAQERSDRKARDGASGADAAVSKESALKQARAELTGIKREISSIQYELSNSQGSVDRVQALENEIREKERVLSELKNEHTAMKSVCEQQVKSLSVQHATAATVQARVEAIQRDIKAVKEENHRLKGELTRVTQEAQKRHACCVSLTTRIRELNALVGGGPKAATPAGASARSTATPSSGAAAAAGSEVSRLEKQLAVLKTAIAQDETRLDAVAREREIAARSLEGQIERLRGLLVQKEAEEAGAAADLRTLTDQMSALRTRK